MGNLSLSQNFFARLVFGLFLTIIFVSTGYDPILSIFLGILGGLSLGWITNASKNTGQPQTVAVSDGIDAGLKYALFFILGFVLLGYLPPMSILLGAMGGLGGGWIIAWWNSKEDFKTQLPMELEEENESELSEQTTSKRYRKPINRYRRRAGSFNFKFWEKK